MIESVGNDMDVLARLPDAGDTVAIVAVRQGNMLVTSFHPELTQDTRIHVLFLTMVESVLEVKTA